MEKWADYGISAKRLDTGGDRIERVLVHVDKGTTFGPPNDWARSEVVSAIGNGSSFVTILKPEEDRWKRGSDVGVVVVDGTKYIRTDRNSMAADNLGELPDF